MSPIPYLLNETTLRIFIAMCDGNNIGRIGYIDVDPENPSIILDYCKSPALDIGERGCFDEDGVLPSCLIQKENLLYMLYSAYQKQVTLPYTMLTGIAVSKNQGVSFERVSKVPFLERTNEELFVRTAAFSLTHGDVIRIYYSSGRSWTHNKVKEVPTYDIKFIESNDFFHWTKAKPKLCIPLQGDEYGLSWPQVYNEGGLYKMIYSIRSISKGYRLGYAESKDGIDWTRMDEKMEIDVSEQGWDSEMLCFGNLLKYKDSVYLFYCGNHYGLGGLGYAELVEE
jgi:hypothetical protein